MTRRLLHESVGLVTVALAWAVGLRLLLSL